MPLDRTWLNAQVDDSGSGTDGSILDKADFTAIYDAIDAALAASTTPGITTDGTRVQQIAFAATQSASADANTLDDYEEGSWTPTIQSGAGGTPTYTTQTGRFIKVGKFVFIAGTVTLATKGTLAAGGSRIGSLPFTVSGIAPLIIGYLTGMTTSVAVVSAIASSGAAYADMYYMAAGGGTGMSLLTIADIGATVQFQFSGVYEATA